MARSSTPQARKPRNAQRFTRLLLAWYARAGRQLPWRRTRDPYRVLVSEFMLQQTPVGRVTAYYPRVLARVPDLQTLARARPRGSLASRLEAGRVVEAGPSARLFSAPVEARTREFIAAGEEGKSHE